MEKSKVISRDYHDEVVDDLVKCLDFCFQQSITRQRSARSINLENLKVKLTEKYPEHFGEMQ